MTEAQELPDCTGCVGGDPTDPGRTHVGGTKQHPEIVGLAGVWPFTSNWEGVSGSSCEHRTTGERAWCSTCQEWCYPHSPCIRCGAILEHQGQDGLLLWKRASEPYLHPGEDIAVWGKYLQDIHAENRMLREDLDKAAARIGELQACIREMEERPAVSYDAEANALYIRLSRLPIVRTESKGDLCMVDYAEDGSVVGLELLQVRNWTREDTHD